MCCIPVTAAVSTATGFPSSSWAATSAFFFFLFFFLRIFGDLMEQNVGAGVSIHYSNIPLIKEGVFKGCKVVKLSDCQSSVYRSTK